LAPRSIIAAVSRINQILVMIELLSNLPDNVVGITASNYETVVVPVIEAALKKARQSKAITTISRRS